MNSPISKCPECKQHTIIYLDKDIIHITCQCEYHFEINIKDFIKYNKKDEPYMSKKAKAFKDITDKVTRGSEDLLTYFTILQNEHINQLIRLINKLESSYDLSYTRNKNMLSYMQILIDNYDGSSEMKNSILDSEIKIYECKDSNNIEEMIKYFTGYNIIEHIKIEEVRTIKEHTTKVNSFLLLSVGRVASCSDDCSIRIYIPSKDFHCEQVLWRYPYGIYSICEADDGTIVSCTRETITIGENTLKNPHDNSIFKVISLPNNRIASCSLDNTIKIWKINKSYSKKPIRVLEGHGEWVTSLLYVKERDIMISGSFDKTHRGTLRLWDMSIYQCDNTIGGVGCFSTNSLYQIDKDRVIVGY